MKIGGKSINARVKALEDATTHLDARLTQVLEWFKANFTPEGIARQKDELSKMMAGKIVQLGEKK